jgi:hypothetical protein
MNNINKLVSSILEDDKNYKKYNVLFTPRRVEKRKRDRLDWAKRALQQEHIEGDLDLSGIPITDVGNLKSINGNLDLSYTKITDLRPLKSVGGWLDLSHTPITDLGSLESVDNSLDLYKTNITSLGSLKSVRGYLDLRKTPITNLGSLMLVYRIIIDKNSKLDIDNLPEYLRIRVRRM